MIRAIDFIKEQERLEILSKIHELKPFWKYRVPMFSTLGTTLYLDGVHNFDYYRNASKKTNQILSEHFSSLYRHLKELLQNELKEEVQYEETLALPGFHIFSAPQNEDELALLKRNAPSIHFDVQFLSVPWNYKNVEKDRPISFTAALQLPAAGSGLNYWDITYEEHKSLSKPQMEKLLQSKETHYCPYQEGKIVIHDGFTMHQIAVPKEFKADDLRITLQGHLVRCDQVWRVYW